jgi:hypothetical protein
MKKILRNQLLILNYEFSVAKLNRDYKTAWELKYKIDDYMTVYKKLLKEDDKFRVTKKDF